MHSASPYTEYTSSRPYIRTEISNYKFGHTSWGQKRRGRRTHIGQLPLLAVVDFLHVLAVRPLAASAAGTVGKQTRLRRRSICRRLRLRRRRCCPRISGAAPLPSRGRDGDSAGCLVVALAAAAATTVGFGVGPPAAGLLRLVLDAAATVALLGEASREVWAVVPPLFFSLRAAVAAVAPATAVALGGGPTGAAVAISFRGGGLGKVHAVVSPLFFLGTAAITIATVAVSPAVSPAAISAAGRLREGRGGLANLRPFLRADGRP